MSQDGRAACEFPILYYLSAWIYRLFGEHEFILRLINLSICTFGFFSLFRLLFLLIEDTFYAFVFTFLFLSSTILLYYANNFLPDAAALGLTLSGWYYSYRFLVDRKRKSLLLSGFLFFALSSLIKVTTFLNPAAFFLVLILADISKGNGTVSILWKNLMPFIFFTFTLLLVIAWNLYAIRYNHASHDSYFLLSTRPVWEMDKAGVHEVFDYIFNYWYSSYYYQSTLHVFAILAILGFVLVKFANRQLLIITVVVLLGSVSYFLLFFEQFRQHDYYFLGLIPGLVFVIINAFTSFSNRFPVLSSHLLTRLAFLVLCLLSLNYARQKMEKRYDTKEDLFSVIGDKLDGSCQYLDEIGVSRKSHVVLLTDLSPNGGLYFLDRQGWTLKDTSFKSMQTLGYHIFNGAEVIILTDRNYLENPNLVKQLGVKLGEQNNILVYKAFHTN